MSLVNPRIRAAEMNMQGRHWHARVFVGTAQLQIIWFPPNRLMPFPVAARCLGELMVKSCTPLCFTPSFNVALVLCGFRSAPKRCAMSNSHVSGLRRSWNNRARDLLHRADTGAYFASVRRASAPACVASRTLRESDCPDRSKHRFWAAYSST
jgi:hypothetical protein